MGNPTSSTGRNPLKPTRSPLYPILIGLIAAFIIGGFRQDSLWVLGSIFALGMWTILLSIQNRHAHSFALLIIAYVLGSPYLLWRLETIPDEWGGLPPREWALEIEIDRLYQVRQMDRAGGIGKVRAAPPIAEELVGKRISYYLNSDWSPADWHPGQRFFAEGVLSYLPSIDRTEGFQNYLRLQDVHLSITRGKVLEKTHLGPQWAIVVHSWRNRIRDILRHGEKQDNYRGAIFAAMMLGERALIAPEQEEKFARSGTLHLFAISGLHVMAVAATIAQLLALTRMPARYRAAIGLLVLLLYVLVTGYSPSAVRAYSMVFFFWGSRAFLRQPNAFSALINSAIAVLLWDPRQLWLPGFQLSYCVVGGLITFAVFLQNTGQWRDFKANWLPWRSHQQVKPWWIKGMVAVYNLFTMSLTATLFSAPLIITYFGLFSPGAIFLNMLLVPLAGLLVTTGCLVMILGIFSFDNLVYFYNHATWLMIAIMELKIDLALGFPGYFQNRQWPIPVTGPLLSLSAVALSTLLREAYRKNQTSTKFTIIAPIVLVLGGIILGSIPFVED